MPPCWSSECGPPPGHPEPRRAAAPTPQNNPAETAQLNFANEGHGGKVPDDGCHSY
ncbi:MAG: hypothetical protein QOG63_2818 [Thermoleophilaceae bacterium]|nr:hypothetical protein [Thermoleophilaceae bacterium]